MSFPDNHPYREANGEEATSQREVSMDLEVQKEVDKGELTVRQTEALVSLAEGVQALSKFVTQGGLQALVAANTKGQIIQAVLGGLAAHDGRNSLDARTIKQNSLEIVETIESVFNKLNERLKDRNRDPEIKEPSE